MKDLFSDYGIVSGGMLNVSPCEAFKLCSMGVLLVDVREEYLTGFKSFDVSGLIYIPGSKIEVEYRNLSQERYMIFADTVGLRSKEVVCFLKEKGFEKIANMAGGLVDWERDGLPVSTDISNRLSGSCMCQLKPREKAKKNATKTQIHKGSL
jgi:rhodanese-related sulfurtransferase